MNSDVADVARPVWRLPWSLVAVAVVVGMLSLLPFWDSINMMWEWWLNLPEYSHCLLLPPTAAFLIWQQKDRLERMPFTGSWAGVAVVLLGGLILLMGQLGTVFTLVQYAFVVTVYGLVLSFMGWAAFRVIAVPLLILFFMVPLPEFLLANLSTQLQLISSQLGVLVIRLLGISVFLEGNVIDLGGYKLQVAEACSGLRYLFPLMTLAFLAAYFYKGAMWKRVVLFLSSIPITVIMNSIRVGVIGVMVEYWGIGMAEGFLHEFQGWMVFVISMLIMLGEVMVLNRIGREAGSWRQLFGVEFPAPSPKGVPLQARRVPAAFLAACALLLSFIALSSLNARPAEVIPQRASFAQYPMNFAEWRGRRNTLETVYLDTLQLDDYVLADYVNPDRALVNVYISWYNSQRKGEAVHSPRACLPAGGWQMREFDQREIPGVRIDGQPVHVNRVLIELGNERQLVYYWFQQRGRIITNEFAVKWYLFWDSLTRHRSDGAMVRLVTPLPPASSVADADRHLSDMLAKMSPDLTRYVPD